MMELYFALKVIGKIIGLIFVAIYIGWIIYAVWKNNR